jgi:hypothetical protein
LSFRFSIDRSIVKQTVEDVKTAGSRRNMALDSYRYAESLEANDRVFSVERLDICLVRINNSIRIEKREWRAMKCRNLEPPVTDQLILSKPTAHKVVLRDGITNANAGSGRLARVSVVKSSNLRKFYDSTRYGRFHGTRDGRILVQP